MVLKMNKTTLSPSMPALLRLEMKKKKDLLQEIFFTHMLHTLPTPHYMPFAIFKSFHWSQGVIV